VVYARTLNERTLTLIVSGKLWRNSLIMQDVETGTLWSHVTGEALEGPATGQRLEALPSVQTTWEKWLRAHPGTEVLAKDRATGSTWDLERGAAIDGPLEGHTLEELPVTAVYLFAWSSFYPNTAVVE
jgi:hypothetical protein